MKRICVYGSLRLNEYNYTYFKQRYGEDFKWLKTIKLQGYKLYSLGSYPGIKESKWADDELVCDIIEVSPECYNSIFRMEIGADYECKIIPVEGIDTTIYLYKGSVNENNLINNGDWSNRLVVKENELCM